MHSKSTRTAISQLTLAGKLLLGVFFVQLLLFLPGSVVDKGALFNIVWVASAILCFSGFMLANAHLGLSAGVSDVSGLATRHSGRAGLEVRTTIVLGYYLSFLVPLLNAIVAIWIYIRIRLAIRGVEQAAREATARDARRRDKFGPIGP